MKNRVLVISPHPDDESIGCGGAICNHTANGDAVDVVFLTSGERGGHGRGLKETRMLREAEAGQAASILKLNHYEFWRLPDGAVQITPELISRLRKKILEQQINIIYVPHPAEAHPDHQAAAALVQRAVHPSEGALADAPVIWMYEVWTPIQNMDYILDISPYAEQKRRAILAHKCQCDVLRFDEAALSLNRYRGEMHSWPGGDYAEVFMTMKD